MIATNFVGSWIVISIVFSQQNRLLGKGKEEKSSSRRGNRRFRHYYYDAGFNRVDYTVTFKKEWDKVMPPNQCEVVRNYDHEGRSKMNHLFVRVRLTSDGEWLEECIQ